jgi:hypothetical protein
MGQPPSEIPARYRTGFALHIYLFAGLTDAAPQGVVIPLVSTARQLVNPSGFNGALKSLVKETSFPYARLRNRHRRRFQVAAQPRLRPSQAECGGLLGGVPGRPLGAPIAMLTRGLRLDPLALARKG